MVSVEPELSYRQRTRSSARSSADARAVRTRKALMDAAERIVLDDPAELTAARVAAAAGVSRSAFYVHFDNLPNLAEAMLVEKMLDAADGFYAVPSTGSWSVGLRDKVEEVVSYFGAHRRLYQAVRNMPGAMQAFDALRDALTALARQLLEDHPGLPDRIDPGSAARWLGGGAFNLFDGWLQGEIEAETGAMAEMLYNLLPEWFRLEQPPIP